MDGDGSSSGCWNPRHAEPPRHPDPAQTVCAATSRLVVVGGMGAVTTRAIAAESGVSIATLAHQFTNRDRLLGVMAGIFGVGPLARTSERARGEDVAAFVPVADDDVLDARVWLARVELRRSHPGVAARVAHVRSQERLLLGAVLGRSLDAAALDCAHAMVEGLRAAVCSGDDPMPVERASSALQLGLHGLRGGT